MKRKDNRKKEQKDSHLTENNPAREQDSKGDFPGYPHYPAREDIMDQRTGTNRVGMNVEDLSNSRNRTGAGKRFTTDNSREEDFSDINPRTEVSRAGVQSTTGTPISEIGIPHNVENNDLDVDIPGTDMEEVNTDADVTPEERMTLENMYMPTDDEENLGRSKLDNTDLDGDELNEGSFGEVLSSAELDIPEETDDTLNDAMGQGDEENSYYSLGGDRQESNREDPYSGPNRGNDT